eukprot:Amastigsp_a3737_31.p3 type:complete len:179 gc:universal Amastigsp_a3737_31:750-214(-)
MGAKGRGDPMSDPAPQDRHQAHVPAVRSHSREPRDVPSRRAQAEEVQVIQLPCVARLGRSGARLGVLRRQAPLELSRHGIHGVRQRRGARQGSHRPRCPHRAVRHPLRVESSRIQGPAQNDRAHARHAPGREPARVAPRVAEPRPHRHVQSRRAPRDARAPEQVAGLERGDAVLRPQL